jgi:hypothetical protein
MANKKDKFIITEEMIANATDYIPFSEKMTTVNDLAEGCIEAVDKITDSIATETQLPIPQLYKERSGAKQYFLMYYLLTRYLHIDIKEAKWNDEEYDYYASSHIFNQLERLKSGNNADVKAKVFDILYDYKQLKQMLETEIYNLKESRNDTLTRLQDSISLFASPDNVKKLNDLLQKTIADTEVAQKKLADKRATAVVATNAQTQPKAKPTEKK